MHLSVHHHLCRLWPAVVVRTHGHSISARAHDSKILAPAYPIDHSSPRQKISGLAYGTDNIGLDLCPLPSDNRGDVMVRVIQGRPHEVIHSRIDNNKGLFLAL